MAKRNTKKNDELKNYKKATKVWEAAIRARDLAEAAFDAACEEDNSASAYAGLTKWLRHEAGSDFDKAHEAALEAEKAL